MSALNPALLEEPKRRKSSYGSFTRVVVIAIDSSDYSRRAFDWYVMQIWKADDLVVFVHCPETPRFPSFSFKNALSPPIDEWKKIMDEMNSNSQKLEEEYSITCQSKKIKYKMRAEAEKNVGEGILRIAAEERADLIVLGSRGTGESRMVKRGTVAEYVGRHSYIPVLIIPLKTNY
ncbi:hypothetical protein HELRODRAFT_186168 [Helobdella robusta]|uniref:UspA domain-containing protein n=1 Tax=Helobdella robusta TaxID=6412 RepID=T1FNR5_HELRO|nr:hypothetical protein HELRODRAFT_186168 [Helobdella robusta]ESN92023.1 hypothetical protein HELRODRAFT_186168 [Helobdella robusta]